MKGCTTAVLRPHSFFFLNDFQLKDLNRAIVQTCFRKNELVKDLKDIGFPELCRKGIATHFFYQMSKAMPIKL
jgi:hypothetical protein